jgi:hypothetical protein
MSAPGVVAKSTCPDCGSPKTCCAPGRKRDAVGHGEPAEGREGGDVAGRATAAPLALQLNLDVDDAGAVSNRVGRSTPPARPKRVLSPPLSPSEV